MFETLDQFLFINKHFISKQFHIKTFTMLVETQVKW